ncbi:iron chelate uptake ABC transporter family permease subunit [Auraticoccus sp. F435]|uniref:Iron chelate uptake ABC transporter family permease subunit n=1 Tax=Auraticoccus cholistanensis TaxID=2656650 RepID=A0A6A9V0Z2_9ACTN|nr:iron chelate uptake ABC transporter family permease subunit [Auraticoccus cholistanensis]
MVALAALTVAAVLAFGFIDLKGSWEYALGLRARQVAALLVVGVAVGASSVVFQTIAGSRILTPGVMGFDSLYLLVQTVVVYVFGTATFLSLGAQNRFLVNLVLLTMFGLLLFRWLFRRSSRNLFVLVLIGVVCGSLFAALTSFASRLLSPNDYLTLQDVAFASFTTVDADLLGVTAVITAAACLGFVPLLRRLDIVDLGHDTATGLGVGYHRVVLTSLVLVTVLVASSTALVGPMTFLGLIVANLARQLLPTHRHAVLVPAAALVGAICTVLGQTVVVHVFALTTTLSVVVNLVGGLYFLYLLMRTARL